MPARSAFVLFYRRNAANTDTEYYITYNYSTFNAPPPPDFNDIYKVKFQHPGGAAKTVAELTKEIEQYKNLINVNYGIPLDNIFLKLSENGHQFRFVTRNVCGPNFYNLPGGNKINDHETYPEIAAREVSEELGFDQAELLKILNGSPYVSSPGASPRYRVFLVNYNNLTPVMQNLLVDMIPVPIEYDNSAAFAAYAPLQFIRGNSEILNKFWRTRKEYISIFTGSKFGFTLPPPEAPVVAAAPQLPPGGGGWGAWGGGSKDYYEKYLKYKAKYLKLKNM